MVQDGANGRLVTRGNVKALAAAIADLAADDALRLRLGDAAALTARMQFDWPVQAEAYERIYTAELARRRPGAARRDRTAVAFKKNPYADVPKVKALLANRPASGLLTVLLRQSIDELTKVIAARGGEILALRAEMARHSDVVGGAEAHVARMSEEHHRQEAKLQDVIAARGGEIRELRKVLGETQQAAARRKEVLSQLMRAEPRGLHSSDRLAVGILGVGESGRRVLEAAVLLDCNIVWLSDNNADLHGQTDLGCAVIRPEAVSGRSFDVVVIASSHRDAIRQQLLRLGIDAGRVVAPDVTRTDAELLEELRRLLEPRRHVTPHSARSSTGRS